MTFLILVFAAKLVKGLNMLGGETCDISHSCVRSKTWPGVNMLGGETCDISHSRDADC